MNSVVQQSKSNQNGLQIEDHKIQPIVEFPEPKNIKQLQRLIGMKIWYRRFIPHFAEIISGVQISFRRLTKVGSTSKFWFKLTDVKRHCHILQSDEYFSNENSFSKHSLSLTWDFTKMGILKNKKLC